MKHWLLIVVRWAVLASALFATIACHQAAQSDEGSTPVDVTLMAFLSRARAAHHQADLLEGDDPKAATQALTKLVSGPLPPAGTALPEVREVLADTRARLAELLSREGKVDAAAAQIEAGLALAPEASYFRGHLLEVRGVVEQRRAKALEEQAQDLLDAVDARLNPATHQQLAALLEQRRQAESELETSALPPEQSDTLLRVDRQLRELRLSNLASGDHRRYDGLLSQSRQAQQRAIAAFEQAMTIQDEVIRTQLATPNAQ